MFQGYVGKFFEYMHTIHFPETNIAPKNKWLEYDRFLLKKTLVQQGRNELFVSGSVHLRFMSFRLVVSTSITSWWLSQPILQKYAHVKLDPSFAQVIRMKIQKIFETLPPTQIQLSHNKNPCMVYLPSDLPSVTH